ncbi:hypothetical protein [Ectobacillus sp. sgz5001026]|uniref:hypothetical protein n=1 Tax=Ectobacillus sp. sgz5001026 TaxID=3242473 RepID=UPI0036D41E08
MSFPNIPSVTPTISLSTKQTIPLLLASIAFEELALAHIMNAEAEKIQFVLGTLPPPKTTLSPPAVSITNLIDIDTSVQKTLRDVIKKEMLLEFKFENVLDLIASSTEGPTCGCSVAILGGPIALEPISIALNGSVFTTLGGSLNFSICPNCTANGSFFTLTLVVPGLPAPINLVLNISAADITNIACDATGVTIIGTANLLSDGFSEMVGFNIRINNNGTVMVTLTNNGIPVLIATIPVPLANLSFGTC